MFCAINMDAKGWAIPYLLLLAAFVLLERKRHVKALYARVVQGWRL